MNTYKIATMVNYIKVREDTQYEYLIPEYPFCTCKFEELEQKCAELNQRLPEDVVDVRCLTAVEAMSLPDEIRACSDLWWTSTVSPASNYAYYVFADGGIHSLRVSNSFGFRPIIVRRK